VSYFVTRASSSFTYETWLISKTESVATSPASPGRWIGHLGDWDRARTGRFGRKDPQLSHIQPAVREPRTRAVERPMRRRNSRALVAAASGATARGGRRAEKGGGGEEQMKGPRRENRRPKQWPGRPPRRTRKRTSASRWTSMRCGRARRAMPEELLLHPVAPLPITTAGPRACLSRDAGVAPSPRGHPSPSCPT
jgi:hypothetical protein